jgi:hypothetical protein
VTDSSWRAVFAHPQHPWRDFERVIGGAREVPPAAIRLPGSLAGLPAYRIYLLSDSEDWPQSSTYTFTQSVPGRMSDDEPPEYCLDLEAEDARAAARE